MLNSKLIVLAIASTLALSACQNSDSPEARANAAEADAAAERARANASQALDETGNAISD